MSYHVMFDVDGTLVESFQFDEECYISAVSEVLGHNIDSNWSNYAHVTDTGILNEHLQKIGLLGSVKDIHQDVKTVFIDKIRQHLVHSPVKQITGAADFISLLRKHNDVSLSIATGGWYETANLKLTSAGLDLSDIPIASSDDHYSRSQIMNLALTKAKVSQEDKLTYFGDAEWDKEACARLQFNFILVGSRIEHSQAINDFTSVDKAYRYIGL